MHFGTLVYKLSSRKARMVPQRNPFPNSHPKMTANRGYMLKLVAHISFVRQNIIGVTKSIPIWRVMMGEGKCNRGVSCKTDFLGTSCDKAPAIKVLFFL